MEKKIFLKSSKIFIIKLVQGNSYQFSSVSFSESKALHFLPLSYNRNNLSVKLLKS